jgi:hypothetical protein
MGIPNQMGEGGIGFYIVFTGKMLNEGCFRDVWCTTIHGLRKCRGIRNPQQVLGCIVNTAKMLNDGCGWKSLVHYFFLNTFIYCCGEHSTRSWVCYCLKPKFTHILKQNPGSPIVVP